MFVISKFRHKSASKVFGLGSTLKPLSIRILFVVSTRFVKYKWFCILSKEISIRNSNIILVYLITNLVSKFRLGLSQIIPEKFEGLKELV